MPEKKATRNKTPEAWHKMGARLRLPSSRGKGKKNVLTPATFGIAWQVETQPVPIPSPS